MGPTAILTGASSGIGAAAAAQFLEQGFTVINVSRRDCPVAGVETLIPPTSLTRHPRSKPADALAIDACGIPMHLCASSTTRR